jgi:hypothetical protein
MTVCHVLLGTGALQAMHRMQHSADDASSLLSGCHDHSDHSHSGPSPSDHHDHDETSCEICVQMHQPAHFTAWSQPLVMFAMVVGLATQAPDAAIKSATMRQLVCRGPPQRSALI